MKEFSSLNDSILMFIPHSFKRSRHKRSDHYFQSIHPFH